MIYAIAGIFVIILDQWLKYFVDGHIAAGTGSIQLIPGIVRLVNVQNDGAAFGFLAGGNATIYFIIIAGVFTVAVILAIATKLISSPFGRWCAAIVAAGGLSNCIDRVICTYVQDMICLDFINFPVFNLADVFITVFCILFIIDLIFGGERGLGRHRDDDDDDEDEEEDDEPEEEELEDDEDEAPAKASRPLFGRRAAAAVEEEEDDDEPVSRRSAVRVPERPAVSQPPKETRKTRQAKYANEYEQLKAARAARMQQQPVSSGSPVIRNAPAIDPNDPFAEWERANAEMNARKEAERLAATRKFEAPVQEPTRKFEPVAEAPAPVAEEPFTLDIPVAAEPAPAPAKPAYEAPAQVSVPVQQSKPASGSTGDFDLDAILAEFQ